MRQLKSSPMATWRRSAPSATPRTASTPRRSTSLFVGRARRACAARSNGSARRSETAVAGGYNIIILSDRQVGPGPHRHPVAAGDRGRHHHLIRKELRTWVGWWLNRTSRAECITSAAGRLWRRGDQPVSGRHAAGRAQARDAEVDDHEVVYRYIKSIRKGILVMSKMGISTYQSYCGAQIFDAVGLASKFVDQYFTGTATTIEGVDLDEIAEETVRRTPAPSATTQCCTTPGIRRVCRAPAWREPSGRRDGVDFLARRAQGSFKPSANIRSW